MYSELYALYKFKDELQFRRKEKPINICVDLYRGGDRKITVNSGFPLTDVVAAICKEVGMLYP